MPSPHLRRRSTLGHRGYSDRRGAAIEAFVAGSGDSLFRLAVVLSADVRAGEDLYQETLQRLASHWDDIDNPEGWARRVMHNLSVDRFRAERSRPRQVAEAEGALLSDHSTERSMDAVELRPVLFRALADLTDAQRLVVAMRFLEDRSEAEVADLLAVPVGTVKSTTSRALARLRRHPALLAVQRSDEAAS